MKFQLFRFLYSTVVSKMENILYDINIYYHYIIYYY